MKSKCYTRKYPLNPKEDSKRETEEQRNLRPRKSKTKGADVNPIISVIPCNMHDQTIQFKSRGF